MSEVERIDEQALQYYRERYPKLVRDLEEALQRCKELEKQVAELTQALQRRTP